MHPAASEYGDITMVEGASELEPELPRKALTWLAAAAAACAASSSSPAFFILSSEWHSLHILPLAAALRSLPAQFDSTYGGASLRWAASPAAPLRSGALACVTATAPSPLLRIPSPAFRSRALAAATGPCGAAPIAFLGAGPELQLFSRQLLSRLAPLLARSLSRPNSELAHTPRKPPTGASATAARRAAHEEAALVAATAVAALVAEVAAPVQLVQLARGGRTAAFEWTERMGDSAASVYIYIYTHTQTHTHTYI